MVWVGVNVLRFQLCPPYCSLNPFLSNTWFSSWLELLRRDDPYLKIKYHKIFYACVCFPPKLTNPYLEYILISPWGKYLTDSRSGENKVQYIYPEWKKQRKAPYFSSFKKKKKRFVTDLRWDGSKEETTPGHYSGIMKWQKSELGSHIQSMCTLSLWTLSGLRNHLNEQLQLARSGISRTPK